MAKPPFRENDETPKREDDVHISLPWFKFDGSGKLLVSILTTTGLLLVGCGSLGFSWWHDRRVDSEHDAIVHAQQEATNELRTAICVLTLNEFERKEYRTEGKYCQGKARFSEESPRDERQRYTKREGT